MRLPLLWLHDYCEPGMEPFELATRLALTGTEVDRVLHRGVGALEHFVVGRVLLQQAVERVGEAGLEQRRQGRAAQFVQVIRRRLESAQIELASEKEFDAVVVNSADVEQTAAWLAERDPSKKILATVEPQRGQCDTSRRRSSPANLLFTLMG